MLGTCGGGVYHRASGDESGASSSATSSTSLQAWTTWRTCSVFIDLIVISVQIFITEKQNDLFLPPPPQSCMRSSSPERRRSGGTSVRRRLMVRKT